MRRVYRAVLLGLGLSVAAQAAVQVAAQAAPAAYNWTGFYIGGNVGAGWGTARTDTTLNGFNTFVPVTFAHSDSPRFYGVIGGLQAGYNWQAAPNWVYGLEADWQGSAAKANQSSSDPYGFFPPLAGTAVANFDAQISWFGTARGRIGYAWDRLLVYATGGLAYGGVKLTGSSMDSGIVIFGGPFSGTAPIGASKVKAGWTLGAGIEGALAGRWTWKAEYLYVDLGSLDFSSPGPFAGETVSGHARFTTNIVRGGINYRF
jgi:outer membrane immunogenic protein